MIVNTYKPRSDHKMIVYPYARKNALYVAELFWEKCGKKAGPEGNNVYGMITS